MLDNPKLSFEFLTTLILGLIGAIVWLPPVFATIDTAWTSSLLTSAKVSASWNILLLILLTKYAPVDNPVAEPS